LESQLGLQQALKLGLGLLKAEILCAGKSVFVNVKSSNVNLSHEYL